MLPNRGTRLPQTSASSIAESSRHPCIPVEAHKAYAAAQADEFEEGPEEVQKLLDDHDGHMQQIRSRQNRLANDIKVRLCVPYCWHAMDAVLLVAVRVVLLLAIVTRV